MDERTVTIHLTEPQARAVMAGLLGAKAVLDCTGVELDGTRATRLAIARVDEALRLGESARPS